jgi:hypothetical protein
MFVPRYLRLDGMEPTTLSTDEIRPYVHDAMVRYIEMVKDEYGDHLLSLDELVETSLQDHHIVLINGEYLLAYYLTSEWFSTGKVLAEEYLMRMAPGETPLSSVFDTIRVLVKLHGAKEAQLGPGSKALRKLYAKHGAEESLTIMRVT